MTTLEFKPDLTPEQKEIYKEYYKAQINHGMKKMEFATYLANHATELLIGISLLMVVMWSLGFLCGKITP
jgi:hypothetical protein